MSGVWARRDAAAIASWFAILALAAITLVLACGSTESQSTKGCTPGESRACTGPGACKGGQTCSADGKSFGSCDCGSSGGAGGSSGTGGGATGATGGAGGSGGTSPSDASTDGTGGTPCPALAHGPPLVAAVALSGETYCIDSTEITQAEYAEFLAANPSSSNQSAYCSWNTTYVPFSNPLPNGTCGSFGVMFDPANTPDYPVVCVDWCDAFAYCAWAGKHLCGRIGGGPADPTKLADPNESEWLNACSHQGTRAYPYGDTYDFSKCNYVAHPNDGSVWPVLGVPSSQYPECEGGFPGLYQMSGNVVEWEDGCSGSSGADDLCPVRGGRVKLSPEEERCDYVGPMAARQSTKGEAIGFRCCAGSE